MTDEIRLSFFDERLNALAKVCVQRGGDEVVLFSLQLFGERPVQ